jgi:hypothetical protein
MRQRKPNRSERYACCFPNLVIPAYHDTFALIAKKACMVLFQDEIE